jgi:hypothetical protein
VVGFQAVEDEVVDLVADLGEPRLVDLWKDRLEDRLEGPMFLW